jgi:hypothetical protein
MAPQRGGLSFDDALTKHVGQFGPAQRRVFFSASLLGVSNALFVLLMVRAG